MGLGGGAGTGWNQGPGGKSCLSLIGISDNGAVPIHTFQVCDVVKTSIKL